MICVWEKVMGRKKQRRSLIAPPPLEGALLITNKSFPYFMLIALEAGGPLRALVLLLISPILWLLKLILCEHITLQAMIFVSSVVLRVADVKADPRSTLPKFLLKDSRESAWRVLLKCGGKKYVLTCIPRIMVEPFLKDHLGVDHVIGARGVRWILYGLDDLTGNHGRYVRNGGFKRSKAVNEGRYQS